MRRAVVTGASGFLGSWLCLTLRDKGVSVTAVMRSKPAPDSLFVELGLDRAEGVRLHLTEALTPEAISTADPDVIFHMAGVSQAGAANADPVAAYDANSRAVWLLLDAVQQAGSRALTLLASTDSVYGTTTQQGVAHDENSPVRPAGHYEASKLAGETAAFAFAASGALVVIARLGNIYGPGDRSTARLIPSLIDAAKRGVAPVLRGQALSQRCYLEVRDCIAALISLARKGGEPGICGRVFNISGARAISSIALARLVLTLADQAGIEPVLSARIEDPVTIRMSSSALAEQQLAWVETIPLEVGLSELLKDHI